MISTFIRVRNTLDQLDLELPKSYNNLSEELNDLSVMTDIFKLADFLSILGSYINKRKSCLLEANKNANKEECSKLIKDYMFAEYKKKYNDQQSYERKLAETANNLDCFKNELKNFQMPELKPPRGLEETCWNIIKTLMVRF